MKFGSVCSGIEAASVAWHPLGWKAAWLAEIEPFPCAVLGHHYPDVPNWGDMTTIARRVLCGEVEAPDVLTGGTPCQAFSVAGLRESLADERGNLTLKFVELADAIDHVRGRAGKPAVIAVWENVPGVLSTKDNAFGCFLAGLAGEDDALEPPGGRWSDSGCVYGPQRAVAWRTLDAQYFGLAQRRRRVFVVASARAGFDPAQVLFEWEGVRRDSAPSRQAGQSAAATLDARTDGGGFLGTDGACGGQVVPVQAFGGNDTRGPIDVATARNACASASGRMDFERETFLVEAFGGGQNCAATDVATALHAHPGGSRLDFMTETFVAHSLRGEGFDASEDGTGRGTPLVPIAFSHYRTDAGASELSPTLQVSKGGGAGGAAIAFGGKMSAVQTDHELSQTLQAKNPQATMTGAMQVRRLTPRECERLQGFPDDWTLVPHRGKAAADGPRYKSLGNSWAVPVARWIGERIALVDSSRSRHQTPEARPAENHTRLSPANDERARARPGS